MEQLTDNDDTTGHITNKTIFDRLQKISGEMEDFKKAADRTIITAFLQHLNCQSVLWAAREKQLILCEEKQVIIFTDSREKRNAFRPCKKALYERKMKFILLCQNTTEHHHGRWTSFRDGGFFLSLSTPLLPPVLFSISYYNLLIDKY